MIIFKYSCYKKIIQMGVQIFLNLTVKASLSKIKFKKIKIKFKFFLRFLL